MAELAGFAPGSANELDRSNARRTLAVASAAHALHDGYTDLIYVLLPIWQSEFALGYGMVAALRGLYAGAMAVKARSWAAFCPAMRPNASISAILPPPAG